MSEINPFYETEADLVREIRARLAAMRALPLYLGPRRRRIAELCQLVGLEIDRSDDGFWRIVEPGRSWLPAPARGAEERKPPAAVQPGRYVERIIDKSGSEYLHYFLCRECGERLDRHAPGVQEVSWWDAQLVRSVRTVAVTDRFLHDRWHAAGALATLHDLILAETLTSLFGA